MSFNAVFRGLPLILIVSLAGCASTPGGSGQAVVYRDTASVGAVTGVGVESQDVVSVSDTMVRDLLATPSIMQLAKPPRIIMDGEYFQNDSTQPLNKNVLIDRLRINLQRASQGRLVFVSRENAGMVAKERELKREGVVDTATTGLTRAMAGGDFRLAGRISSLDSRSVSTGMVERYNQISFELIDLESGVSVWANMYEFKKAGLDDAVYR